MNENDATALPIVSPAPADAGIVPTVGKEIIPPVVDEVLEVISVEEFLGLLGELVGTPGEVPDFMEVPFTSYGVTDGLLLLLLLFMFLSSLWKIIRGVF